ncbi:MAG: CRISPR-associated endonuclease Cas2 [Thermoprotei archaeon]|nr:MAG: CRISPR-associated endonuclease Cas2 [Thermoprotei archaeon]
MFTLVIYDISDDNLRLKISEICKNFGLSRIQKSAFFGRQTSSARKELIMKLKNAIAEDGTKRDNIQIFTLDSFSYNSRVIIGSFKIVEEKGVLVYV